jgi:hypothetical protein
VYKLLVTLMFLSSCSDSPLATTCEPHGEIPLRDSSTMCSASKLCTTGDLMEYDRHICFCDLLCICFHSIFTLSDTCVDVNDTRCKRSNMMTLFGGGFCKLSKAEREVFMLGVRSQSKEVSDE